jgi:chemotaxis protein methyltransferase CheR
MPATAQHSEPAYKRSQLWTLLRSFKHDLVVRFAKRENRVYTQFCRFPHQLRAVVERVVPTLRDRTDATAEPLNIIVFACCSGEEAFSLSYALRKHYPGLGYQIRGFDIVSDVIEKARSALFTHQEVRFGPFVTDEFVATVFQPTDAGQLRVKAEISAPISFAEGSLLDKPFMESLGKADMVFAQNVLFHLPRFQAREALRNIHGVLKTGGALFINGVDTDMRAEMTKRLGLTPLDYLVEEIHNDARVDRGYGWSGTYVGRKPFTRLGRDWLRKQGTIFYRFD